MTRPTIDQLREAGLLCTKIKRDGEMCTFKKRPGYDCCARHGAPSPSTPQTPVSLCDCPICYEWKPASVLICNHAMCKDCADTWLATNSTCPMCRAVVKGPPKLTKKDVARRSVYAEIQTFLDEVYDLYENTEYPRENDDDPVVAARFLGLLADTNLSLSTRRRLFV